MSIERPDVVVITGPTASGKSDLAVEAALAFDGEIVNADSVQIYRGFDIGSAKPSEETLRIVPHHLYSVLDPACPCNAGWFVDTARRVIDEICARGKLPIIAGGTGLYLTALLGGLVKVPQIAEEARAAVTRVEAEAGSLNQRAEDHLYSWLAALDPSGAAQLHKNDLVRVRRALMVRLTTGSSLFQLQASHCHAERPYRALVFILSFSDRETLYRLIDERVHHMIEQGLVDEVKNLSRAYPLFSPAFDAIGYRHAGLFLRGELSRDEMMQRLKRDTRRFAKRQMTWWRNQPLRLGWRDTTTSVEIGTPGNPEAVRTVIDCFLRRKTVFDANDIMFFRMEIN